MNSGKAAIMVPDYAKQDTIAVVAHKQQMVLVGVEYVKRDITVWKDLLIPKGMDCVTPAVMYVPSIFMFFIKFYFDCKK